MDKQQTVLIADDEAQIREILRIYFEKEGFKVVEAADGAAAIIQVQASKPDIVVLDIMMPVLDGLEVCRQVRKISDIPIIMLTAKDEDDDRILGLEIGADDYITKPFSVKEIDARIQSVIRRTSGLSDAIQGDDRVKRGNIRIDRNKYEVFKNDKKVELTLSEFRILLKIFDQPNKVHTREELMQEISNDKEKADLRTIDVHIRNIRKKLEADSEDYIETVRGIGYRVK